MASVDIAQKRKENRFRMDLLLDHGNLVLQDVLSNQLQVQYPGLYGPSSNGVISDVLNDQTVKHSLLRLKRRKILNPSQIDILYPPRSPAPPVTLHVLDITLTVILLRNITNLNPHAKWDKPPDTDTSTEANIGRVRKYRNEHAHNIGGLSDADFKTQFADLKAILLSLSRLYTSDDYDKLLIQPLDASETPCQLLSTTLPRTNTDLKGRDGIITTIQQHIRDKVPLILLTGMGGIGKTSIAVKVGQSMQNVLYIDMRQVTDLNSVKLSLVQHYHPTRHLKDLYSDYQNIFKQTLSSLTTDTLFILDNNESFLSSNRKEFSDFLKDVMDSSKHISLLCASRERFYFPTHNIVVLEIDKLDKRSSRDVLWVRKSTSPTDSELANLDEMAEMCGYNPLALQLLAALLYKKQSEAVLEKIKTQKILPTLSIPSMPEEIKTYFDISYETLKPEARKVFVALHLFPVAFNLEEASVIVGLDQNTCEHILDILANKSLISTDGNIYDIHPLLREYAAYNAQKYGDYIFEIQDAYCSYYIHALKIHVFKMKYIGATDANILSVMLPNMKQTAALLIKILKTQDAFKQLESIDNLAMVANIFCCIYLYQDALHIYKLVSHEQVKLLGPKHPDTASSYDNIGTVLQAMGKFKESLDYHKKCLALNEEILGPKHPDTARSYDNIGNVLQAMGEYKESLDYHKKCIALREEILGPKHPDTASSYSNIGNVLQDMGEYKESLDYHKKCIALTEEVLGPKHPDTALSYNNIGTVLQALGEYKESLNYHKKCLALTENILGKKHPNTASSYNNIGNALYAIGEYKKSLDYFKKSLALREEILGLKHPDTAIFYNNIGNVLHAMGKYKESLNYHKKCLALGEETLGTNHPSTAISYNNIGTVLQDMGKYKESLDYYKKCLALTEEILGPKHPDIATSYNNIGAVLQDIGEYKESLDYHKKCLALTEEKLGPKHPSTATFYNSIGAVMQAMGEYKESLDYHKKCLALTEEKLGPKHPDIATSYNNIGIVLHAIGEYKESLDYHKNCLALNEEMLGPKHPNTATSYNNIGAVLNTMGKYKESLV
ncbi:uncharacterized protein LOC106178291 [Lingula anatina]|uniref:Uncharacterized protein LOC106178291 n=1 Tax=Lingula anatina TaxID=7574 RepID=A0A1S3K2K2_LINAN|nr:uncharacterized protein LOC106178291 [Lingula anatina]|eukprot:XP_013416868.1 uncharacterized protein LOC106178291 [Lingula anatina]